MAKIAISLPDETLGAIERERKASGESRRTNVLRAVERHLKAESEAEQEARYIQGYLDNPETLEDVEGFIQLGLAALADMPWEPEDTPS
ncbi:MAG: hypothetical protein CL694_03055 [Chloroflexi bacterium]|jgi:metal-responsive CopG/Arc/MetJ family transcriptional regulator|nr:hypothetical protein [Chloroflexota bacterium]